MDLTRVDFTPATENLLRKLHAIHGGAFMFHQSGGCCDGSAPMCYPAKEFRVGGADVLMETLTVEGIPDPIPFYMSLEQFEVWSHTHLTIDAIPGRGSGFSLESPEGMRFLTRSRLFADEEAIALEQVPLYLGNGEPFKKPVAA
jgi:uncharacterized protein (DUF779 family)